MGASAEVIEQYMHQASSDEVFDVWPDNWVAVGLFLDMGARWHTSKQQDGEIISVMPTGLVYSELDALMRIRGIKDSNEEFNRLRIMEAAALKEMGSA